MFTFNSTAFNFFFTKWTLHNITLNPYNYFDLQFANFILQIKYRQKIGKITHI